VKESKSITETLDDEYLGYAMYTIENRAIPSAIDGFKPTQRKVIHMASKIWKSGTEKPIKIFQLSGKMAAECAYHHGDGSASSAAINLAQKFKNSMPLLEEIGQFGSMRSPEPGAARYISTRLSENYRLLYKDQELTEPKFEDGLEIEPKFMLPIVPTVLLNGSSGIAVGFATNILNRDPKVLIESCLSVLNGKKFIDPLPWWKDWNGIVTKTGPSSFQVSGTWRQLDTSTIEITELPPSMTFSKFDDLLEQLIEKGVIKSYEDNCGKQISYKIKLAREILRNLMTQGKVESTFRLVTNESENLTCLDQHGKLREFETAEEIVRFFVDFRLGYYSKRKDLLISKLSARLAYLNNRARFIKSIMDGQLKVNRRPKADILEDIVKLRFDKHNDGYGYLLDMPIHSFTKETYESLIKEANETTAELETVKATEPIDMYRTDLKQLLKSLN